jgi:FkbM family methyltransferase
MRDGSNIVCRLKDAGDVFSVYVHQDYSGHPIDWDSLETVIDIGATVGSFTLWAAKKAKRAHLYVVEPNPAVYPFLLRNITANGLSARADVLPIAIGASRGYGSMVEADYSTLATVRHESVPSGDAFRIATLDELMSRIHNGFCDLLKLDCEGAEYDILLGSTDDALRRVGTIICEYHPVAGRSLHDLTSRLVQLNFRLVTRGQPYGLLFATRRQDMNASL